jgi:hypothetical protein
MTPAECRSHLQGAVESLGAAAAALAGFPFDPVRALAPLEAARAALELVYRSQGVNPAEFGGYLGGVARGSARVQLLLESAAALALGSFPMPAQAPDCYTALGERCKPASTCRVVLCG